MRIWLPVSLLACLLLLVALAPWRREHPNHTFMFEMVAHLAEEPGAAPEASGSTLNNEETHAGTGIRAGHSDDRRSA